MVMVPMTSKKLAKLAASVHECVPIIGLCGYGGVGKDWIAAQLLAAYPSAVRVSFAEPMRQDLAACKARYDEMWKKLRDPAAAAAPKEVIRPIYVTHGTVVGNAIDPEFWLYVAEPQITQHIENRELIIITDVRRLCEVDMIMQRGGVVVNVERVGYGPAHPTEALSIAAIRSCYDLPVVGNDDFDDLIVVYDVLVASAQKWPRARQDGNQTRRAWEHLRNSMKTNYGGLIW